jgi:putative hydrolase of the HAD superfamily
MYSPGTVLRVFLEREGILKYFKAFVFSDEVGYSKPDIRAFESIREQLASQKDELAYHIGDLQKTDVKGANNAAYISIQYIGLNPNEPTVLANHVVHTWEEISELVKS